MEQSTRKLPAADSAAAALISPGTGTALYVINLCASMTPIANKDKPLPGFEQYRVYQVSRKEDGRIRYRLRLGFFSDEAEAETALACIRELYPTAFAASLCDEDQRHTRGFSGSARPAVVAAVPTTPSPASVPAPTPAANVVKPAVVTASVTAKSPSGGQPIKSAPTSTHSKPPATQAATSPSDTQRVPALKQDQPLTIEVEWEPAAAPASKAAVKLPAKAPEQPATSTAKPAAAPAAAMPVKSAPELTLANENIAAPAAKPGSTSNEPFHVGKGVDIPVSTLSLAPEPAAKADQAPTPVNVQPSAPQPAKAAVAPSTKPAGATVTPAAKAAPTPRPAPPAATRAPAKAAPPAQPKPTVVPTEDVPLPDFDSTQTIRALTAAELDDETQPKWFAVQLAVSEQPINLDTMPHLDIFAAYSLYSVATAGSGKILHHMRIGFFKEAVSAEAVCGYLKTFFANPTVLRISVAEQARFAEASEKPARVETRTKVIDLATARDRTPAQEIPVVTMEVTPNPSASGRFPKPNTSASGIHKQLPPAKTAARSAKATKTSPSASGKHRTLQEALLAEAREVELSESAIRRLPKNSSLLSKLFGKK